MEVGEHLRIDIGQIDDAPAGDLEVAGQRLLHELGLVDRLDLDIDADLLHVGLEDLRAFAAARRGSHGHGELDRLAVLGDQLLGGLGIVAQRAGVLADDAGGRAVRIIVDRPQALCQHLRIGFAVQRHRHSLAHALVVQRLALGVERDHQRATADPVDDVEVLVLLGLDDVLGAVLPDHLHVALHQAGVAGVGIGQRPYRHTVEIGLVLVPVVGVALGDQAIGGTPLLEDERAGADGIAVVIGALLGGLLHRDDQGDDAGLCQGLGQRRVGAAHLEDGGQVVGDLDLLDRDIGAAGEAVGRIEQAVEMIGHRLGGEGRAVVELHPGPQLGGPDGTVLVRRHGKRQRGDEVALVVEPHQRVVDQRRRRDRRVGIDAGTDGIEAFEVALHADRERPAAHRGGRWRLRLCRAQCRDGKPRRNRRHQTESACKQPHPALRMSRR